MNKELIRLEAQQDQDWEKVKEWWDQCARDQKDLLWRYIQAELERTTCELRQTILVFARLGMVEASLRLHREHQNQEEGELT